MDKRVTIKDRVGARWRVRWHFAKHDVRVWGEKAARAGARRLPGWLRYWVTLGVLADATCSPELAHEEVPGVRVEQLLPAIGRVTGQAS